jgi:hypothetical protein
MSASQHAQHHLLLSSSTPRSSHSSGSSVKQQHRTHKQRLKAHTSYLVLGGGA